MAILHWHTSLYFPEGISLPYLLIAGVVQSSMLYGDGDVLMGHDSRGLGDSEDSGEKLIVAHPPTHK